MLNTQLWRHMKQMKEQNISAKLKNTKIKYKTSMDDLNSKLDKPDK